LNQVKTFFQHSQLDSNVNVGYLCLPSLLKNLHINGIASLMVEGGQRVISSFLSVDPALVDVVIVTIAPMLVGHGGVEALNEDSKAG
jgi:2,5-diamino-6-(ribosylamino)-4(3H)-pyrimidinone 5'-phosphate reductase